MGVDNFFFGMQAVLASVIDTLRIVSSYTMFIGFIIGFLAASVVHALLTAERASHVPSMLFRDPATSFSKVHPAAADGTYLNSYKDYASNVEKMKTVFYMSGVLIIIFLIIVTLVFD